MKKFKFRAECAPDVIEFIKLNKEHLFNFNLVQGTFLSPEVEFEFESDLELDEIIQQIRTIEDSHVMFQTVQYFEKYTGERDFSI